MFYNKPQHLKYSVVWYNDFHSTLLLIFLLFTFLFSRNHLHVGIREKEVEVDWDVRAQILKKCFLLTEIKQKKKKCLPH